MADSAVAEHEKAMKIFLNELDSIESSNPKDASSVLSSAATFLLDIKMSQREIFKQLDGELQKREESRAELERQKILLQNLIFERNHLQAQLEECKKQPTPHLERMSRDELNDEEGAAEKVTNEFLCGSAEASILDPQNHDKIMKKLHTELNSRGALQRDLEKAQSDLTKRRRVAEEEKSFLNDIPKKLEMIERTSAPLQKFFQTSTANSTLKLIGTDRKKRLDMAKSLPGPLYSLFVQFQAHLDDGGDDKVSLEIARHSKGKKAEEVAPNPQVVHLSFSIPDIHAKESSSTKRKRVTVEFAFVHEYNLVTAQAFGFLEKINAAALLENLFPGDVGIWIGQPNDTTVLPGKPYHWCNFLAGIHLLPPARSQDVYLSSKAVIRELGKKVRSNATLTQILATFDKKKPLVHPLFATKLSLSNCKAKLTAWGAEEGTKKQAYLATVKNGSNVLSARVVVNWSRYPIQRPTWSLCPGATWTQTQGSDAEAESNPVYDSVLGEIEAEINGNIESFADTNDPTTFDWILSHQLVKLLMMWDSQKNVKETGTRGSNKRARVGRDRL